MGKFAFDDDGWNQNAMEFWAAKVNLKNLKTATAIRDALMIKIVSFMRF